MPPKLTHAPRNPGRRSRAERQALDKAESERRQARLGASAGNNATGSVTRGQNAAENAAAEENWRTSAATRGHGLGGSLKYVRGGRGGFIGQRNSHTQAPSGPRHSTLAGQPTATGNSTSRNNASVNSTSGSQKASSRSQRRRGVRTVTGTENAPIIKPEPDATITSVDAAVEVAVKREREDHSNSSDNEENTLGKNVERINLVSDDDDEADDNGQDTEDLQMRDLSSAEEATIPRRKPSRFEPLRMPRTKHRERSFYFNAQDFPATPAAAAARKSKTDNEGINLDRTSARRSRTEDRDVEMLAEPQRAAVASEPATEAKPKPTPGLSRTTRRGIQASVTQMDLASEDEAIITQGEIMSGEEDEEQSPEIAGAESKESVAAKLRSQPRRASRTVSKRPILQTEEERKEHLRQQRDLEDIQYELGNSQAASIHREADPMAPKSRHTGEATKSDDGDKKDGAVFLFQFPPILPDLFDPAVQPTAATTVPNHAQASKKANTTHLSRPAGTHPLDPIKIEEAEAQFDSVNASSNVARRSAHVAPGHAGQLVVHQSGRTFLKWGRTSMEVSLGINPYFLQTVVLADIPDLQTNGQDGDAMQVDEQSSQKGEAVSFGQVRGKFIVTPDWGEILG